MIDAREIVRDHNILFVTLDTLRYDVAVSCLEEGRTPFLKGILPKGRWERRHTPGSFTYAAHHAFFAGFLPTPARPGNYSRLFAARFQGSETTGPQTFVFDAPDIVSGLSQLGYHTLCIGGTGFFNKRNPLGKVLPNLFDESHWSLKLGVTDKISTKNQADLVERCLERIPTERRIFLFVNISAIHQPNHFYVGGAKRDSLVSHAAALEYVDGQLPRVFRALQRRGPTFCIICSDHGTAYGEDGFRGHRLGHQTVWEVPYAEAILPQLKEGAHA